jgi:hypothetical protein
MPAVPVVTPDTTPEVEPIVATAALPLLQVPPPGDPVRAVVPPTQTVSVPKTPGIGFTVTIAVEKQPPIA